MIHFEPFTLSAPSRLHFGLFAVGDLVRRKFGGMGLMIEHPRTVVEFQPADHLVVSEPHADLIRKLVATWFDAAPLPATMLRSYQQLPLSIRITHKARRHVGLGSGTQLALSLAAGLAHRFQLDMHGAGDASFAMQRGKRSAIGSYGFDQGGFLVDRGITDDEIIAPLDLRIDFPTNWPVVLVLSNRQTGLFGSLEQDAFQKLPDVTFHQRDQMIKLAREHVIPGILSKNYDLFAPSVYEFGKKCGEFFADLQGGPFNGPLATEIVQLVRDFGVPAVGQSSWGPCIFAVARHENQAQDLVEHLHESLGRQSFRGPIETIITRADNYGKRISARREIESV